ncbi:hypothetical protein MOQ_007608 [Trypanosoma cruzi marinkellei]|uniref:Uncharacterized protein n=1 Tax=Trypanosoma cruzi marinkellei TaxID=85056 RepID=K2M152_TRYCR|nr:hypothetical protein MOQ_007608 [Trypanosoma cruzi marinkellei]
MYMYSFFYFCICVYLFMENERKKGSTPVCVCVCIYLRQTLAYFLTHVVFFFFLYVHLFLSPWINIMLYWRISLVATFSSLLIVLPKICVGTSVYIYIYITREYFRFVSEEGDMPLILRLCLYAVSANGNRTQLWLSFPILRTTTPKDIILFAWRTVEERMAAELEMHTSYQSQLALCIRNVNGQFVFLGTAAMEDAENPIVNMPFFEELLSVKYETLETMSSASLRRFIFTQGALVPVPDLLRLNHKASGATELPFSFYEVVEVTPELSSDPLIDDPTPSALPETAIADVSPHAHAGSSSPNIAPSSLFATAPEETCGFATEEMHSGRNTFICVQYIDFAGQTYEAKVRRTDAPSLQAVMSEACEAIGAQVGCLFQASNMRLMCNLGNKNTQPVVTDSELRNLLEKVSARFYLAVDARILASSSPNRLEATQKGPGLMLKETRDEAVEVVAAVVDDGHDFPWAMATSAATLRQLGSLHPTPSFSSRERLSILRTRPTSLAGLSASTKVENMRNEEDTARLRLASAHFSMDEARRKHETVVLKSMHDATYERLCKKKAVLIEEWTECISAERDCQRLETLLTWLEKDLADGNARQEKLIRALYAA